MIGKKMVIMSAKTKDIVRILKVEYGQDERFVISCISLVSNKNLTLLMTANEVKNSLMG